MTRFALSLLTLGVLAGCQTASPPPAPICPPPPPVQCPEPLVPAAYVPFEQSCPPIPACPPMSIKVDTPLKSAEVRLSEMRMLDGKILVGEAEYVTIQPGNLRLDARIDSGATTTSMHATDIKSFERDGQRWVRFTTETGRGGETTLELPRVRHVRIKGEGDEYERRPVVMIDIQIGGLRQKVEATLTDRDNYHFPLLIGRNFLRDHAIVDVSRKYVQGGKGGAGKPDPGKK
ncbi:MAG: ATP-dependent zinc protease [Spongiibacteraceae bacterium]